MIRESLEFFFRNRPVICICEIVKEQIYEILELTESLMAIFFFRNIRSKLSFSSNLRPKENVPYQSHFSFEQNNWSLEFCSLSGPIFSFSQSFCCRIICILAHAFKIQIFLINNIFKLCHCSVLIVHMNFSLLELLISNTDSIFDSETLFLTIYNISETVSSRTFWLSIILSENKIIF